MSIWATNFDLDATIHAADCGRWVEVPPGQRWDRWATDGRFYRLAEDRPCTCRCGPLAYHGSHVMPADDGPRRGSFDLAEIPAFVAQAAAGEEASDDQHVLPWLRVGIHAETADGELVVLDRGQVERLHGVLTAWLERTKSTSDTPEVERG